MISGTTQPKRYDVSFFLESLSGSLSTYEKTKVCHWLFRQLCFADLARLDSLGVSLRILPKLDFTLNLSVSKISHIYNYNNQLLRIW